MLSSLEIWLTPGISKSDPDELELVVAVVAFARADVPYIVLYAWLPV